MPVPGFSQTSIERPRRCMWPPTAWIVTGRATGRSQVVTALGTGCAASRPQIRSSPVGTTAESAPKRSTWSKTAAVRSHSGPLSPAGRRARRAPGEASSRQGSAAPWREPSSAPHASDRARARSEVVVNLHHDAAPGRQGDARSARSGRPRCRAQAAIHPASSRTLAGRSWFRRPTPGPPKHVQPAPGLLRSSAAACRDATVREMRYRITWWTSEPAPGTIWAAVTNASLRASGRGESSGSRRSSRWSPSAGATAACGAGAVIHRGGARSARRGRADRRAAACATRADGCDCAQRISVSRSWSSSVRRAWPTYGGDRADGGHGGMRRSCERRDEQRRPACEVALVRKANGAIPPSRWQPGHVSWTIGATSRAKSGAALPPSAGSATAAPSVARGQPHPERHPPRHDAHRRWIALGPRAFTHEGVVGAPELSERAAQLADRRPHRERRA